MKKILVLCLAVIMLFSVSITTLAAGAFVSSPSGNDAPILEDFENESEDCDAIINVNSYADRDKLSPEARQKLEKAYEQISSTDDITDLIDELKELGIDPEDLGVSDLFDISSTHCGEHDEHGNFTITLKPENLENFAALVYFDGQNWKVIDGAKVTGNGTKLTFKLSEFGPYAIITNKNALSPSTSNNFDSTVVIALMGVVVLSGLTLIVSKRKA